MVKILKGFPTTKEHHIKILQEMLWSYQYNRGTWYEVYTPEGLRREIIQYAHIIREQFYLEIL